MMILMELLHLAGAVASRPIASRAPAVRPAVGAAKPRVGGVTRPGVTAKTNGQ